MNWNDVTRELSELVTKRDILSAFTASVIFIFGFFIAKRASVAIGKLSHLDTQQRLLLSRGTYYGIAIVAIAAALNQLGFDLKVLLGAAGILTVAVGFAAQTSASNLISGLFLMVDKPFVVGDIIQVGDQEGELLSIDLLSCRIRTFNNLMIRIPNESMVKSNIINYSYFPIRRIEMLFGVHYKEDMAKVERVLMETAARNPLCLVEPNPLFIFRGYGDSSMDIKFCVWALSENYVTVKTAIYREIKETFDREGIVIPYPHRTMVTAQIEPSEAQALATSPRPPL